MSLKFSQGVVNSLAVGNGWGDIIKNGVCVVYSGNQPQTADLAATAGTELVRFTTGSATITPETRAAFKVTLTGATGNVTALTVGGVSIVDLSVLPAFTTVSALVTSMISAINSTWSYPDYYAIASGTTVGSVTYGTTDTASFWVIAPKNSGASLNALTISCTVASGSAPSINGGSSTTVGGTGAIAGVAATNGLSMTYPATSGTITKSGTWSGTSSAGGTAGWFRIICTPNYDTGLSNLSTVSDDARLIMRIDGTIGTSGADMLVTSTLIAQNISQSVSSFSLTVPS